MRLRSRTEALGPTAADGGRRLADVRGGSAVLVADVALEGPERLRLAEFGLRPGATITLLKRTAGGGYLVAIGTSRIALDRRTASALTVSALTVSAPVARQEATRPATAAAVPAA